MRSARRELRSLIPRPRQAGQGDVLHVSSGRVTVANLLVHPAFPVAGGRVTYRG